MFYLIYLSYAKAPFSKGELIDLLTKCRGKNQKLDITGMLVYLDGKFIQVLEGSKETVYKLYDTIYEDSRHKNVSVILEGELNRRNFSDWSMGFKSLLPEQFEEITGYTNPDEFMTSQQISDNSHPALIFLKLFYEKNDQDLADAEY